MEFRGKIRRFFKYRKAMVHDVFFKLELNKEEYLSLMDFVKEQGYRMDNHIAFELDSPDWCECIFVRFSDNYLYFGTKISEKEW